MNHCHKFICFIAVLLLSPLLGHAQFELYAGEGFGKYRFYQGPFETRAWEFNNFTNVTIAMNPKRNFNGLILGSSYDLGHFRFGIDWAGKKNSFGGTRESSGTILTDNYKVRLNSVYLNLGFGNRANIHNQTKQHLVWRLQTGIGFFNSNCMNV